MKTKKAPTKREQQKIDKIRDILSNIELYGPDHMSAMYSVNVKLHGQSYESPEDLINELKNISDEIKDELKKKVNDEILFKWCDWYIESQAEYVIWMLNGYDLSLKNWYTNNLLPKIEAGDRTGYPHIDNLKTKAQKIKQIKEWDKTNNQQIHYLDLLESMGLDKDAGFYGRMGGHFCLVKATIADDLDNFEGDPEYYSEIGEQLDELLDKANAVKWFLNKVESAKDAMIKTGFHNEMIYRLTELANEVAEDLSDQLLANQEAQKIADKLATAGYNTITEANKIILNNEFIATINKN